MDRAKAIRNIAMEARQEHASRSAMIRLERSLKALGCDSEEIGSLMSWFDYWDADRVPYIDKHKAQS